VATSLDLLNYRGACGVIKFHADLDERLTIGEFIQKCELGYMCGYLRKYVQGDICEYQRKYVQGYICGYLRKYMHGSIRNYVL
jgi:hypothetical protein